MYCMQCYNGIEIQFDWIILPSEKYKASDWPIVYVGNYGILIGSFPQEIKQ